MNISLEVDGRWKVKEPDGRFSYHESYEDAWRKVRVKQLIEEGMTEEEAISKAYREVKEFGKELLRK